MINLIMMGSKSIIEVDYIEMTLRISDKECVRDIKIKKEEPLELQLLDFIDCVRHDKGLLVLG